LSQYYIGKIVAVSFFIRLCLGIKQVINPVYKKRVIEATLRVIILFALDLFAKISSSEEAELTQGEKLFKEKQLYTRDLNVAMFIQYIELIIIVGLIVSNVRSFVAKLLVTLKNLLRDNDIHISLTSTLLIFSFMMGTYYLSILLQFTMNLSKD
jgi:hypothetical protein